jgi:hypothetical protein
LSCGFCAVSTGSHRCLDFGATGLFPGGIDRGGGSAVAIRWVIQDRTRVEAGMPVDWARRRNSAISSSRSRAEYTKERARLRRSATTHTGRIGLVSGGFGVLGFLVD